MTGSVTMEPRAGVLAAFVAAAMMLGGGGSPAPVTELALQVLCACAALLWLWQKPTPATLPPVSAWIVAALTVSVPLLQLVPLPAAWWQALPGQGDRVAALALVGGDTAWHAASLAPSRTLAGLLAAVPAVLTMLATTCLSQRGRNVVLATVAAVALVAAVLGAIQASLGDAAPRLYAHSNSGVTGFQANKNAAADVFLIGLIASCAVFAPSLQPAESRLGAARLRDRRAAWGVLGSAVFVLVFAVVFTRSRAGTALVFVALAAAWMIVMPVFAGRSRWHWLPPLALVAATLGVVIAAAAAGNTAIHSALSRFAVVDDFRRQLWQDGWFALQRSWPAGIGVGGAEPALVAAERLEIVDQSAPNRIHNDYLEFVLEGGLAAVMVLMAGGALLAAAAVRAWRLAGARAHVVVGAAILLIIALHSLVDYPLRSMALACLTGLGAGLLFPGPDVQARGAQAPVRQ